MNADAILVSQIVTQKDVHIRNLTELIELLEAKGLRERFVVCAGGTRISNKLAVELGYDAGFGQGTYAEHVATFLIEKTRGQVLIFYSTGPAAGRKQATLLVSRARRTRDEERRGIVQLTSPCRTSRGREGCPTAPSALPRPASAPLRGPPGRAQTPRTARRTRALA